MATDNRLLTVLRAFNKIGTCTVQDVHRVTGISRPAVYRIVANLCRHGYLRPIPNDKRFRLTSEVKALSAGYREDDWIAEIGAPILERLQADVRWPTSLAMPDKDRMVVRETTRHRSPFVFDHGAVGLRLPMLHSSLGLAYIAHCEAPTRAIVLALLRYSQDRWDALAKDPKVVDRLLRNTVQRGYAFRQLGMEAQTSSIAVPIMHGDTAVASMCVTFADSALTQRRAATELLPLLRRAANDIEQLLQQERHVLRAMPDRGLRR